MECLSSTPQSQFFGFSLASAYASYYLLQEYKLASSLLQGSVEDLQDSTSKVNPAYLAHGPIDRS